MNTASRTIGGVGSVPAHGGLLVLTMHVLVAPFGLSDPTSVLAAIIQATFFATLVLVLFSVAAHRAQLVACLALVAFATLIRVVGPSDSTSLQASADLALVGCGVVVMWRSVDMILRASTMNAPLITASIALYLLAGITWAIAFHAVVLLAPGSFSTSAGLATVAPTDLYFFSFVTITTLGYGDISPVLPVARSLALLEAIFGQIFLVALLGRIVSVQVANMGANARAVGVDRSWQHQSEPHE